MLNPFPSLLTYGLLAPFLIRITLGVVALWGAQLGFKKNSPILGRMREMNVKNPVTVLKGFSLLYALAGLSLTLGFYTQIGALLLIALYALMLFWEHKARTLTARDVCYYTLVILGAVSLLFSGAGFLAFDLPL